MNLILAMGFSNFRLQHRVC